MISHKELCAMAQTAAMEAAETLIETIGLKNPLNPTPEEARAYTLALAFTIAQLELTLKINLPPEGRKEIRQLLDAFSNSVEGEVNAIKAEKEVDKKPDSGTIDGVIQL